MNICLVIPSLDGGGMERVMSELANYFASDNEIIVHLIILSNQKKYYKLDPRVIIYEPDFKPGDYNKFITTYKTCIFLRRTNKKINPEFLLSFGETYNSFVILSLLFTSYRVFVSDRTSPNRYWGFVHERLRKYLYAKATGIIAQTNDAKLILSSKIKNNNFIVIGNPIKHINIEIDSPKENIVLSVGRLIKSKRFDVLIKLFSEIDSKDWKLQIIGEGPEEEKLQNLIHKLNVENRVELLGHTKNVEYFFQKSKIFAFTSNSEGFPNVIGEALRAKLPVISFNFIAGATDLIVNRKNGYLIEMDDNNVFKNKLTLLINDETLRGELGEFGSEYVKKYDVDIIGKEFLNFMIK